jgi:hypothetical protein
VDGIMVATPADHLAETPQLKKRLTANNDNFLMIFPNEYSEICYR